MGVLGDLEDPLGPAAVVQLSMIDPAELDEAFREIYRRFGAPFTLPEVRIDVIAVKAVGRFGADGAGDNVQSDAPSPEGEGGR